MEAVVTCTQEGQVWEASMKCDYTPEGESTVEVTAPETIAGVKAVITQEDWSLAYEDVCLNAGTLSEETVSPAVCLPRLMSALRDGWLLEENREDWNEVDWIRQAAAAERSSPTSGCGRTPARRCGARSPWTEKLF